MKLDMHCHVREGSVDSRVSLDEYITTLKKKGFDGMAFYLNKPNLPFWTPLESSRIFLEISSRSSSCRSPCS